MPSMRGLLLLALGLSDFASALRRRADGSVDAVSDAGTNRFIIELASSSDCEAAKRKLSRKPGTIIHKTFESDVFNGLSVETTENNADLLLKDLAGALNRWPVRMVPNPAPNYGPSFSDDAAASNYSIHGYTGVDKAHASGIFGKGVVVAVVDTGIDYNHEALGRGFGPGFKVNKGYDLVGDGRYPITPKVPDADPMDQKGHGTHVAGIIAGKSDSFVGVAPEATLHAYKVFGSGDDGTEEDVLIEAFIMAYNDGADIITASIGGASGWSDGVWATVASRIVDMGVVVTIAAANFGFVGPFFASSGSSGKNVIAVASMEPKEVAADPFLASFTLDGVTNTTSLAYLPATDPYTMKDYPIVPISLNTSVEADACTPLPSSFPSLKGSIALVRRGGCDFIVKQANILAAGGEYMMVYNLPTSQWQPIYSPQKTPLMASIEPKAGEAIVKTIAAGGSVRVDFSQNLSYKVNAFNSAGGIPSDFTSWGPLFDLQIKPDIAAPGGNIYSSYLGGGYQVLSGTSMATPYVAGIAALYIGLHGGRQVHGPDFARNFFQRVVSSGAALPWSTANPRLTGMPNQDYGYFAPVAQVGAGLLDAGKLLNYTTTLTFEKFALNDTANFMPEHEVSITNGGSVPVEYTFSLQPAGGLETFQPLSQFGTRNSLIRGLPELGKPISIVPGVDLPAPVMIAPGETKTIKLTFTPPSPAGLNVTQMPLYSGKVLITGGNGESLSVPYLGTAFSLSDIINPVYTGAGPEFWARLPSNNFSFDLNNLSYPVVYSSFDFGVSELRWDIFEAGWTEDRWTYPPVVGENGYIGSATYYSNPRTGDFFNSTTMNENDVLPFPAGGLTRSFPYVVNGYEFWWLGSLAHGKKIPSGRYRMRFAALRPMADPKKATSWNVWQIPETFVNRVTEPTNQTII